MPKTLLTITLAAAAIGLLAGCAAPQSAESCPDGFEYGIEYQLFFGLNDDAGHSVSAEDWQAFVEDTITPRFPAGLSQIDVLGQWEDPTGMIQHEETILVRGLMAPPGDEGVRLVNEISEEYERRFNQDPVFRVIQSACYGIS